MIGTGSSAIQSIPLIARAGGAADRVPAHRRTSPSRPATARSTPDARRARGRRDYPALRARSRARDARGVLYDYQRRSAALDRRPDERDGQYEAALGARAALPFLRRLRRSLLEHDGQRHRGRVRARARSARSSAIPKPRAELLRPTTIRSAASASASTPTTSRPSTGRTSRWSTCATDPIERIDGDGHRNRRRGRYPLDAWSSPPASTR